MQHSVRIHDGVESVGNCEDGAAGKLLPDCVLNYGIGRAVSSYLLVCAHYTVIDDYMVVQLQVCNVTVSCMGNTRLLVPPEDGSGQTHQLALHLLGLLASPFRQCTLKQL